MLQLGHVTSRTRTCTDGGASLRSTAHAVLACCACICSRLKRPQECLQHRTCVLACAFSAHTVPLLCMQVCTRPVWNEALRFNAADPSTGNDLIITVSPATPRLNYQPATVC